MARRKVFLARRKGECPWPAGKVDNGDLCVGVEDRRRAEMVFGVLKEFVAVSSKAVMPITSIDFGMALKFGVNM